MIGRLFDAFIILLILLEHQDSTQYSFEIDRSVMADSVPSSSLVSVNSPTTYPFFRYTFLEKDTGMIIIEKWKEIFTKIVVSDLDETPTWNNDLAILLSFWLQQRANNDDIFRRYANYQQSHLSFHLF